MKGISLPIKTIVVLILAVLVLVLLLLFVGPNISGSVDKAEAEKIFLTTCAEYKKLGCDETYLNCAGRDDFKDFVDACKIARGPGFGDYSCLYNLCLKQSKNTLCDGICSICKSHADVKIELESCCSQFLLSCSECDVCR